MFRAARQAYMEYEHSHNPCTTPGDFDYAFQRGGCAFYVLDGRGHRDIERDELSHFGTAAVCRFANWIEDPHSRKDAVPVRGLSSAGAAPSRYAFQRLLAEGD